MNYWCNTHGLIDEDATTVFLFQGAVISRRCTRCYMDWIAANVPEVERIGDPEHATVAADGSDPIAWSPED